ncbi:pyridoxamine 5'-phosphate oxidase [soil metagenome]
MQNEAIAALRRDYSLAALDESAGGPEPLPLFERWLDEAASAHVPEPNAMTLATVDAAGRPRSRIVLLKGVDSGVGNGGFKFYTNYDSAKGREIAAHPYVALQFHWVELERQVRIEGRVSKVDAADSDAYFASRPVKSRIGAWASPQSDVMPDRESLEARFADAEQRFGDTVPRPPHWGGYRVVPDVVEFWQGRRSRLHDRLRYRRDEQGRWIIERLAP